METIDPIIEADDFEFGERAKLDFEYFVRYILKLPNTVIGEKQLQWAILAMETKNYVKIAPRGHGKSVTLAQAYALWRLWKNPNLRIVLASESQDQAKKNLRGIKAFIERPNSILNALKPDKPEKWGEIEIIVTRDTTDPQPSLMAVGVMVSSLGTRADLIIFDDVVSDKNSATIALRDKLKDWFFNVALPFLDPNTEMIVQGTLWHPEDLYHYLSKSDTFLYDDTQKDAIIDELKMEVLWPEKWPYEELMIKKEEMGSIPFVRQYRNDMSKWKEGFFKEEWFRYHKAFNISLIQKTYVGVDLSTGIGEDYFAIVVIGVDDKNDIHVMETYHNNKLEFPEQAQKIRDIGKRWGSSDFSLHKINIESNAYQVSLTQHLKRDSRFLPVIPVKADGNKKPDSAENRFLKLTPLFESGRVWMDENETELQLELLQCPFGGHDDLLDAFYYSVRDLIRVGHKRRFEAW